MVVKHAWPAVVNHQITLAITKRVLGKLLANLRWRFLLDMLPAILSIPLNGTVWLFRVDFACHLQRSGLAYRNEDLGFVIKALASMQKGARRAMSSHLCAGSVSKGASPKLEDAFVCNGTAWLLHSEAVRGPAERPRCRPRHPF